ncbi:acetylornithine deacetylase or succinyl- diaminopimelate desuccinylase [Pirellula staleyi DSM 6068]|uniref:Acetylornithine deacetylase or succinyl-diaminopimelate desuccinylase n=1 Tax=Pirellula staleyi (strain ATCC 27377 / DSM 6068 / ICPB 4128) TaxID=530564 RepID=D2QZ15_PIRSD|nr:M20 family metallopeptidase [Pirellula staleyi]ADB16470.1 acetylornithine deacetylase or succinyl- diaminopimelate desuccinylase [Pirellula staleyi DSM 6068]
MSLDVVATLADLVRIPSVNPMGRATSGDIYYEHRVTDYLEQLFRTLELPYERVLVSEQRPNIIARVDGDLPPEQGGKVLMFEAHQDTVPIEGMTIDPFDPKIESGKLFGRGSCDIKGGMSAMLGVVARLHREKPRGRPTVVMACTVNEEHGFTGATHWARAYAGFEGNPPTSRMLQRVPDATIVAEPTSLDVVVAHKGGVRWRCHTVGRATHSSQPHLGENAIYAMARLLPSFEKYALEVAPTLGSHHLCGKPTLSVGTIKGGISVNTVPDRCTIEIDRRLLPGESPETARQHVIDYLAAQVPNVRPVHDEPFLTSFGLADDCNGTLASELAAASKLHGGRGGKIGVPYGTDAPRFAQTGCPTVVFGPGSIDQAHTCDEWIEISQLQAASEILYDFAANFGR